MNYFTLKNCFILWSPVNEKHNQKSQGIPFDKTGLWRFSYEFARDIKVLDAVNSSSSHYVKRMLFSIEWKNYWWYQ